MSYICPHNMVNLLPTSDWDRSGSLRHPFKFQRFSCLGSITARHLVVGVSQTLRRWTEGATCVRQGDHHVGHLPTFLVVTAFLYSLTRIYKAPVSWNKSEVIGNLSYRMRMRWLIGMQILLSASWVFRKHSVHVDKVQVMDVLYFVLLYGDFNWLVQLW